VSEQEKELLEQTALRSRSNPGSDPMTGADLGAGPGAGSTKGNGDGTGGHGAQGL